MTNLKRIRENKNFSQSQLAGLSGVSLRILQYYEQGYRDINKTQALTLYKLAQVLECNIEDLLELKKEVEE